MPAEPIRDRAFVFFNGRLVGTAEDVVVYSDPFVFNSFDAFGLGQDRPGASSVTCIVNVDTMVWSPKVRDEVTLDMGDRQIEATLCDVRSQRTTNPRSFIRKIRATITRETTTPGTKTT